MQESAINNKTIVKNTIYLYLRMLVVMVISLYTVRAFLSILGETDYGLSNVIGGVVGVFSFLNSTLATSSQKYFSQALVTNDITAINKVFSLNITIYLIIIFIIVIILETAGLWFVNTQMTIPPERMFAANVVYQITVVTFILQMITVSYNALIIAHERMKAFAYIGIFEAFMKLGFVLILMKVSFDKLITYSLLYLLLYLIIAIIYISYCRNRFNESKYCFYWNKTEAFEMLGFSGWHLLGTLSVVVRGQGVNILINMFFSPAVNAARAISYQIEGAINQLSSNFFTAVKPQMYKSYSNGEIDALNTLVLRSSMICFFLVSILSIPFYFNTEFILGLWLTDVPNYTIAFTQLVLIEGLIDSVSNSAICPALATGKIKRFYLVTSTLLILTLPISYIFLKLGYDPRSTMIVSITISAATFIARSLLLNRLIQLPLRKYYILGAKLILTTVLISVGTFYVVSFFESNVLSLLFSIIVSSILHCIIYFFFVCDREEKALLTSFVKTKFNRG